MFILSDLLNLPVFFVLDDFVVADLVLDPDSAGTADNDEDEEADELLEWLLSLSEPNELGGLGGKTALGFVLFDEVVAVALVVVVDVAVAVGRVDDDGNDVDDVNWRMVEGLVDEMPAKSLLLLLLLIVVAVCFFVIVALWCFG